MSDTGSEGRALDKRIGLLEEKLLEKEKALEVLQGSEMRYRRLFESAKDGILILDVATGKVIDVNPFMTRLLGYPYETFCGKYLWEIGAFKDIAASKESFRTLQDHEYVRYEDLPLQTREGKTVAVEFVSNIYMEDHAKVIQCNIRDITERKRAEERIRKALGIEMALRRIDRQILEGVDRRKVFGTACHAIAEMGYRMCWIGQADLDRTVRPVAFAGACAGYIGENDFRWDDSPEGRGPTGTAIRTGEPCVIRSIHESPQFGPWREKAVKNGYRSMAAIPMKSGEGEMLGVLNVYSDREGAFGDEETGRLEMFAQQCSIAAVGARRLEMLRDSSQRLAIHVARMPLAYIVWDREFRVSEWNPAAERIFGWKADEAIGKGAFELIALAEARPHAEGMRSNPLERDGESHSVHDNVRKDGKIITCEWFNAVLRDATGNATGVLSMGHDVTEKKELEKRLQFSQRMEVVGTLAGGIAHDFNNALTGIFGFGDLLRSRVAGDQQSSHDLDEILRCAERAATLTRQLLTFAHRQVIKPVNLDLSALVADLGKFIRQVVGAHIEVITALEKNVPTIHADLGQIEQVAMNLCLNARDAMPKGGRLVIETKAANLEREDVCRYPYMKTGRYSLLTVSDTGIGMDEKTRERVFEPFFTTKGAGKGTGLGLAMVYGIVKQHGGFIHLHSEPGEGTVFKLYFPAIDAQPDSVPKKRKEEVVRGGKETILLGEDEEAIRSLLEQTLKVLGYNVLVARNGEEAIEVSRGNKEIALAVLDLVMPRKGGREAFEEMRRQDPRMKAIFMSGYSPDTIQDSFVLTSGMSFLQKPFGPTILARKVREVLDGTR